MYAALRVCRSRRSVCNAVHKMRPRIVNKNIFFPVFCRRPIIDFKSFSRRGNQSIFFCNRFRVNKILPLTVTGPPPVFIKQHGPHRWLVFTLFRGFTRVPNKRRRILNTESWVVGGIHVILLLFAYSIKIAFRKSRAKRRGGGRIFFFRSFDTRFRYA